MITSYEIGLQWVAQNPIKDNSALVQVIVREQAITWAYVDPDLCHNIA